MEQSGWKPVADPLTVYDCSLISDGAAAVVIVLWSARLICGKPIRCWASRRHRTRVALLMRKTTSHVLGLMPPRGLKAYQMAGVRQGYPILRTA